MQGTGGKTAVLALIGRPIGQQALRQVFERPQVFMLDLSAGFQLEFQQPMQAAQRQPAAQMVGEETAGLTLPLLVQLHF